MHYIDSCPIKVAINLQKKRPGGFIHTTNDKAAAFPDDSISELYCDWSNETPLNNDAVSYLTKYLRNLKYDGRFDFFPSDIFTAEQWFDVLHKIGFVNVQKLPVQRYGILAYKKKE
jgi:hypothetical protein